MRTLLFLAGCSALCLALPACSTGPRLVKATGTLLNDGKPFTIGKGGSVTLVFIPTDQGDKPFNSPPTKMKAADSSFAFSQGIPSGKYRVQIMQMVMPSSPEIDELNERFSKGNSPIIVEVKDGTPIIIDVAKVPAS
jgi:hypothetical protein